LQLLTIFLLLLGGNVVFLGYQTILVFALIIDAFTGDIMEPSVVDDQMHSRIPELSVFLHCIIFAQTLLIVSHSDFTNTNDLLIAVYLTAQLSAFGSHNTVVNSHELMHKSQSFSFLMAQFIAGFALRASGVIDHVYGHHRKVGLYEDNATARRHEAFWKYLVRAVPGTNIDSLRFEAKRLENQNTAAMSVKNRMLQGYALTLLIGIAAFAIGGWIGLAVHLVAALSGMVVVEAGNYIAHYGLVRKPGEKIAESHSWNNYSTLSTSLLLNLPRHSDHHLHASREYWKLEPASQAPCYPFGFMTMTLFAMLPPLFFAVAESELEKWHKGLSTGSTERG
jgi:alkane 1-monooxygenase